MGSGCGSVGRAVASDTRGPRFESDHWQNYILPLYRQLYWKDKNKEKRPLMAHFYKIVSKKYTFELITMSF